MVSKSPQMYPPSERQRRYWENIRNAASKCNKDEHTVRRFFKSLSREDKDKCNENQSALIQMINDSSENKNTSFQNTTRPTTRNNSQTTRATHKQIMSTVDSNVELLLALEAILDKYLQSLSNKKVVEGLYKFRRIVSAAIIE